MHACPMCHRELEAVTWQPLHSFLYIHSQVQDGADLTAATSHEWHYIDEQHFTQMNTLSNQYNSVDYKEDARVVH